MHLRTEKVQQVYWEHFSEADSLDVEDWLFGSIRAWVSTGKVVSFSPFEDFFSSAESEEMSLAAVGAAFPEEKTWGAKYSPAVLFRRALGNVVAREGFYQESIEAWRFALSVAEFLPLSELAEALSNMVSYEPFRSAGRDEGYSLFRDAFEAAGRFGPDMRSREFWKACLPWIGEYPALSLRLLQNLVQSEPSRWAEFAIDSRMSEALVTHRVSQLSASNSSELMEFDLAAQEISKCVSDAEYSKQWSRLLKPGLDFLVDRERLIELGERGDGQDDKPNSTDREASGTSSVGIGKKKRNLRKRAGEVNRRRLEIVV